MMLKKVAALCALSFASSAMADVVVKETTKFQDVAAKVNQLTKQGEKPLIVIAVSYTHLTLPTRRGV